MMIVPRLPRAITQFGRFIDRYHDHIAAVATVVIAVYTVILGKAKIGMRNATRRTVESLEITDERQLRAYVTIETLHNNPVAGSDGTRAAISFNPVWKNSGATPATNVQYYTILDFSHNDTPKDSSCPILGQEKNRTIIGPGIREWGPATRDLTAPEIRDLANIRTFVYGAVNYSDIFGKHHRTEFSLIHRLDSKDTAKRQLLFNKTLVHNGADGDRMRAPYATIGDPPTSET